jgi:hypothetical protein
MPWGHPPGGRAAGDALGNASALDVIAATSLTILGMTCIFSNSRFSIETLDKSRLSKVVWSNLLKSRQYLNVGIIMKDISRAFLSLAGFGFTSWCHGGRRFR